MRRAVTDKPPLDLVKKGIYSFSTQPNREIMMATVVFIASLVLQFLAVYFALRTAGLTGKRLAWSFIAGAIALMALHHTAGPGQMAGADPGSQPGLYVELIALAIAALSAIGIARTTPIFAGPGSSAGRPGEGETRYRTIFENSPISIWEEDFSLVKGYFEQLRGKGVTDLETYMAEHPETVQQCAERVRVVDVNRAAVALHRAHGKEELLTGLINTFTPESFEAFREELTHLWQGRMMMSRDAMCKTMDGEPRDVLVDFAVCPGYEETLSRVFVSLIDVTDRERERRQAELLNIALNNAHEAAFLTDENGRFLYVNEEACRNLEYTREALLGMEVGDIDPDWPAGHWPEHWRELVTQRTQHFERRHKTKSGKIFPVEISANLIEYNDRHYNLALVRNITERKRSEAALATNERQFRRLAENLPDYIIRYDRQGRAVYLNRALQDLLGVSAGERTSKRIREFHTDGSYDAYAQAVDEVLASGEDREFEFLIPGQTENPRVYTMRLIAERDEKGAVDGVLAISRDITDRKQAEHERWLRMEFLANLDRINRAIQGGNDLEGMMCDVLDEVLEVLGCDRTALVYPCDPNAATWQVPMERTRPAWPGVFTLGMEMPMTPEIAQMHRLSLQSEHPVAYGAGTHLPIPPQVQKYGDKSGLGMALYPKTGKPWGFAVIQCSHERKWNEMELRLFEEIGRRLADGLRVLLTLRDLQESEAKYRRMFDTAMEGILTLDEHENITFLNAHMARMLGYSPDELQGRPVTDFMMQEDLAGHRQESVNREQKQAETYERRLVRKDGTPLWTLVSATPIFDGDRYRGALSMVTDITDRKEAELKLKQALEFTEGIINTIPDLLMEVDREGRYLNIWTRSPELLAAPKEALLGRTINEMLSPEAATAAMEGIREADEKGLSFGHILRIELSQDIHWFELSLAKKPADDPSSEPRFLILSRDITERMRMEEELRASEQRFRVIFDQSFQFIGLLSVDGILLETNRVALQFAGIEESEVRGKYFWETPWWRHSAEMRERVREAVRKAAGGRLVRFEATHPDRDGNLHTVDFSLKPVIDSAGRVIQLIPEGRDITERKQVEQERQLRAESLVNMDRINLIIQRSDDLEQMMSAVLDEVLAIFDCDRAFLMFPCDPAAKSWSVPMERTRPEYPGVGALNKAIPMGEEMARTLQRILNAPGVLKFGPGTEHPLPADGLSRHGFRSFMATALFPKIGKPWLFGVHQCSYERVWTEAEEQLLDEIGRRLGDGLTGLLVLRDLRESERRLIEAQHIAHLGNWWHDLVSGEFHWSDEFFNILGIEPQTPSTKLILNYIHPDDVQGVLKTVKESARGKMEHDHVFRVIRPDGKMRWIHNRWRRITDTDGNEIKRIGTYQDITEQKLREQELERYRNHLEDEVRQRTEELVLARNAAEEANKAKSVFLANMSHELRTPLNAILGFSQMMQHDEGLSENQQETLEIISHSGEHLLKLINDVLEIAKIEAGKLQLEIATVDLHDMVRGVVDMMQLRAEQKGLQLVLDQSSEFPHYIKGDEARLRQILVNLVSNAVKFTDEGGVTLRLGVKDNERRHLLIEVEDTGPGIGEADRQKLFKPFVQLAEGTSRGGTGLGLAIIRQFVQLMTGSIIVTSTLGKGTLFHIEVPLEAADESEIIRLGGELHGEIIGLAPGQPTYRILIAEDQRDNQLLLTRLMTNLGLEVKIADNGAACVKLFKTWRPDLIWMDRRMPVMDGMEATRRIRQLPGGDKVKIVAVTASAFKEQQTEMQTAGMDETLRKPYLFSEIYDCLARQLGVEYRYRSAPVQREAPDTLTPSMLADLDAGLSAELREALESLDRKRIDSVIRQIAKKDPALAESLGRIADKFDYPVILQALAALADRKEN